MRESNDCLPCWSEREHRAEYCRVVRSVYLTAGHVVLGTSPQCSVLSAQCEDCTLATLRQVVSQAAPPRLSHPNDFYMKTGCEV